MKKIRVWILTVTLDDMSNSVSAFTSRSRAEKAFDREVYGMVGNSELHPNGSRKFNGINRVIKLTKKDLEL